MAQKQAVPNAADHKALSQGFSAGPARLRSFAFLFIVCYTPGRCVRIKDRKYRLDDFAGSQPPAPPFQVKTVIVNPSTNMDGLRYALAQIYQQKEPQ